MSSAAYVTVVIDTHYKRPYTVYVSAYVGDLPEPLLTRERFFNHYSEALEAAQKLMTHVHGAVLEDQVPEEDRIVY